MPNREPSSLRVFAALALTVAANLGLLLRGPGHSLGLTLLLILLAAGGLGWMLWEQRDRALIGRRVVVVCSVVLLAVAVARPPTESHDVWSYVMIGRTVAVHHSNPYKHPSSAFSTDRFRLRVDPVWRHARSIYGPVFVAMATGVVKIAGDSVWASRVLFQALAAIAVLLMLLIVDRATRGDPRALAFVGLNFIVVVVTVNNAHNDAYVGLAVLGAVILARRRPVLAGALLGLAALVKVAAILPAGVLGLWLWRRDLKRAGVALVAAAGVVTAAGYSVAGRASVSVLSAARDRMNRGALWYPIREFFTHRHVGAHPTARALQEAHAHYGGPLASLSTLAVVALAAWIGFRSRRDAPVVVAAAVIAYTVLGAYILPWYIVWGLPLLALAWRSRMAWLAVALTLLSELAYVPDDRRVGIFQAPQIHTFLQRAQIDLRLFVLPVVELGAAVALVVWSARTSRAERDGGPADSFAYAPPAH